MYKLDESECLQFKTTCTQLNSCTFRLTGDRGIPILPKVFEKVHFKGKGHEVGINLSVTEKICLSVCEHFLNQLISLFLTVIETRPLS